jgi:hypothetical protein
MSHNPTGLHGLLHEGVWGSERTDPSILDLSISCRGVLGFTPLNSNRYPLDRSLSGPHMKKKKFLHLIGIQIPNLQPFSAQRIAISTAFVSVAMNFAKSQNVWTD